MVDDLPTARRSRDGIPSVLADAAHFANQALSLYQIAARWAGTAGKENHIRHLSVYPPTGRRGNQWLIVLHSWSGGYRLVAFHRADDLLTALLGALSRAEQQKLVWKEDDYAGKE